MNNHMLFRGNFQSNVIHIRLSNKIVQDLKMYQRLSTKKQSEYGGRINFYYNKKHEYYKFDIPPVVTSNNRRCIHWEDLKDVWPSLVTFHTHPSIINSSSSKNSIHTTLPSDKDFECFIMHYPKNQCNIICDQHGYYVIDIIDCTTHNALRLPLPMSLKKHMASIRKSEFLLECSFSEERLEYHSTTINKWKNFINKYLNKKLNDNFGIKIKYYSYNDEPAIIRLNSAHIKTADKTDDLLIK